MQRLTALLLGLFALVWASSACAAITQTGIGSNQNVSGGVPAIVTTTATCSSGSAILVMVTNNINITASTNTLIDQVGNTYVQVTGSPNYFSSDGLWTSLWIAKNNIALPSGDTVTFTTSSFSAIGMAVNCVTGLATLSPQDKATAWNTTTFATTLSAPATGTLAHPNEIIVTTNSPSTGATAPTCGGSFATMGSYVPPGGAPIVGWCGLVVSATTSVTGSAGWTTNQGSQIAAFSFADTNASSGVICTMAALGAGPC